MHMMKEIKPEKQSLIENALAKKKVIMDLVIEFIELVTQEFLQ